MVAPSSFRVIPNQRPSSSSFSTSSNCNSPINHRQESLPPDTWLGNSSGLATQGFVVKTFWTPVLIFNDLRLTKPSNPRRRVRRVGPHVVSMGAGFFTDGSALAIAAGTGRPDDTCSTSRFPIDPESGEASTLECRSGPLTKG